MTGKTESETTCTCGAGTQSRTANKSGRESETRNENITKAESKPIPEEGLEIFFEQPLSTSRSPAKGETEIKDGRPESQPVVKGEPLEADDSKFFCESYASGHISTHGEACASSVGRERTSLLSRAKNSPRITGVFSSSEIRLASSTEYSQSNDLEMTPKETTGVSLSVLASPCHACERAEIESASGHVPSDIRTTCTCCSTFGLSEVAFEVKQELVDYVMEDTVNPADAVLNQNTPHPSKLCHYDSESESDMEISCVNQIESEIAACSWETTDMTESAEKRDRNNECSKTGTPTSDSNKGNAVCSIHTVQAAKRSDSQELSVEMESLHAAKRRRLSREGIHSISYPDNVNAETGLSPTRLTKITDIHRNKPKERTPHALIKFLADGKTAVLSTSKLEGKLSEGEEVSVYIWCKKKYQAKILAVAGEPEELRDLQRTQMVQPTLPTVTECDMPERLDDGVPSEISCPPSPEVGTPETPSGVCSPELWVSCLSSTDPITWGRPCTPPANNSGVEATREISSDRTQLIENSPSRVQQEPLSSDTETKLTSQMNRMEGKLDFIMREMAKLKEGLQFRRREPLYRVTNPGECSPQTAAPSTCTWTPEGSVPLAAPASCQSAYPTESSPQIEAHRKGAEEVQSSSRSPFIDINRENTIDLNLVDVGGLGENPVLISKQRYQMAKSKGNPVLFLKKLVDEIFTPMELAFGNEAGEGSVVLKNGNTHKLEKLDARKVAAIKRAVQFEFPYENPKSLSRYLAEKGRKTRYSYRREHNI